MKAQKQKSFSATTMPHNNESPLASANPQHIGSGLIMTLQLNRGICLFSIARIFLL